MIFPMGWLSFMDAMEVWADHLIKSQRLLNAEGKWSSHDAWEDFWENAPALFSEDVKNLASVYKLGIEPARVSKHILYSENLLALADNFPIFHQTLDLLNENVRGQTTVRKRRSKAKNEGLPNEDIEEIIDLLCAVPRMEGCLFIHLDPYLSIIDCSGANLLRKLRHTSYDERFDLAQSIAIWRNGGPNDNILPSAAIGKWLANMDMAKSVELVDHFEKGISFKALEGNTVCFNLGDLKSMLSREYPVEMSTLNATVAAEKAAMKALREFVQNHPDEQMRREEYISLFCSGLGRRASIRVWDAVKADFPHLSIPGRRKVKS